jgi:hypothetical protein
MSRPLFDLESVLQQLIVEHRKLLRHLDAQQAAMKTFALDAMDAAANQQEASRLRIAKLENQRRGIVQQIAKQHRVAGEMTLAQIGQLYPEKNASLQQLRDELKRAIQQVQSRSHVAGRVAGAVLGHLNTIVRLLAGTVERAGVYTKSGVPQVSARIGVMEAVG